MPKKQSSLNSIWKHFADFFTHPRARAVSLLFLAHGLMISTWFAQVPSVKTKLQLNDSELGNVLLALPLGVMLVNIMAGWILARVGAWRSIFFSYLIYATLIFSVITSDNFWGLFASLFFMGWAIGLIVVATNTLAARIEKTEGIFIMSSCHATFSLGAMVGAAISSVAIAHQFPVVYQMLAITLPFVLLIFLHKQHFQSIPVDTENKGASTFGWPNRELFLLIIIGLAFTISEGIVVDWSAVYLRDELGATSGSAALGYGACALTMMLMRTGGDVLVPKFGVPRLLFLGGLTTFLGIMLVVFAPFPWVGIVGFGVVGLGIALGIPLLMNLAARTKGFSDGAGVGIFATFAFAGFIIEPPFVGWIAEKFSLGIGLGLVAVICLLGGLLSLRLKGLK